MARPGYVDAQGRPLAADHHQPLGAPPMREPSLAERIAEYLATASPAERAKIIDEKEIRTLTPEQFKAREVEILAAVREGRIRAVGNVETDREINERMFGYRGPTFTEDELERMTFAEREARKDEIRRAVEAGAITPRKVRE